VVVNEREFLVFEKMHWLCFHLEFEHTNADPDEACADMACPWNQIEIYRQALEKAGISPSDVMIGAWKAGLPLKPLR
jgi:hypothetical protein